MDRWIDGSMDRWIDRWMDGRTDGWMHMIMYRKDVSRMVTETNSLKQIV